MAQIPRRFADQQRTGVEWQHVYGTENVGTRQDQVKDVVTRFLSIGYRASVMKMAHDRDIQMNSSTRVNTRSAFNANIETLAPPLFSQGHR